MLNTINYMGDTGILFMKKEEPSVRKKLWKAISKKRITVFSSDSY